ncbi:hypothetical protein H4R19_000795 [Coemansia spiralis]|nr:hypothetical protein H4R19_000795 [Coemansia spiralis]
MSTAMPRGGADSGPGRVPAATPSAAAQRHAPYARPAQHTPRGRSFADCLLSICDQLRKPLFGQSPGRSSGDTFSVPWRMVDRETSELHAELQRAQHEAAALDKSQPPAAEPAVRTPPPPLPGSVEETASAPPYESVFDAARKLAARRPEHPTAEPAGDKEAAGANSSVPDDDDEDKDDADFAPNESADDDEEEILQSEIEPIDELEEITTPPASGSTSSNAASATPRGSGPSVSQIAEYFEQRGAASQADNRSTDMSVEEAPSSDDESAPSSVIVELQASDADLSVSDTESDVEVFRDDSEAEEAEDDEGTSQQTDVSVEVVMEDVSDESSDSSDDAATEELASIAADESSAEEEEEDNAPVEAILEQPDEAESDEDAVSTQPLPESPGEYPAEESQQTLRAPDTPSSRRWWPFGGSSFMATLVSTQKKQPGHTTSSSIEDDGSPSRCPTAGSEVAILRPDVEQAHVVSSAAPTPFGARRGMSAGTARRAAPITGKRLRMVDHAELRTTALLAHRRRTATGHVPSTPAPALPPSATPREPSAGSRPPSSAAATPLITAASLGLEARRSAVRGPRRRTCLYYGSGYGAHSAPYVFSPVAVAAPTADAGIGLEQPGAAQQASPSTRAASEVSVNHRSSATAQRILDIISEVPPVRPQAVLDAQEVINPYELSSPYSVRMRPKTTQQRRMLVPLSVRLAQAAGPAPATAVRPQPDASSAKAVLASIQSAAPPEIQARLDAAPRPLSPKPKSPPATAAAENTPPAATAPAAANAPPSPPPAPTVKAQFGTPAAPAALKAAPAPTRQPAAPSPAPAPVALAPVVPAPVAQASTRNEPPSSPRFAFTLPAAPALGQAHDAIKTQVSALALADLPAFVLALGEDESSAMATPPPSAGAQSESKPSEWTCEVCELLSPESADKCVVCDAPRPGPVGTGASSPPTAAVPMPKSAEWTCAVCELLSPESADKCVVCDAPRPEPSAGGPSPPTDTSATVTQPKPAASEWTCELCELQSPASADKCVVCDAARPGAGPPKPAAAPPVPSQIQVPAPASGEWTCDLCELQSPATADKCVVCDAARPGAVPDAPVSSSGSGSINAQVPSFAFELDVSVKPPVPARWLQGRPVAVPTAGPAEWECEVCELQNPASAPQCTVCEATRPGGAKRKASELSDADLPVFRFELNVAKRPARLSI